MAAEYIEREALLKKAIEEKRFVFRMEDLLHNEVVFQTVYKGLAEFVLSAPAADVVPVVHGRWKCRRNWLKVVCSNCSSEEDRIRNYCPNCGARMDGAE